MFEDQLQNLLAAWKHAFGQYDRLKAEVEPDVVRWEWTSWERYSPLPFQFQRFPGRGRVLKDGPPSSGSAIQYGFDQQGQIRLHRSFNFQGKPSENIPSFLLPLLEPRKDLYSETFYFYSDQRIEIIEFSTPPERPIPLSVRQITFQNGRVTFHAWFRLNGYTRKCSEKGKDPDELYDWLGYNGRMKTAESYIYEGDRLQRIESYHESPGVPPFTTNDQFEYDDEGQLRRIDQFYADGQKRLVYRKRPKGQTFRAVQEEASQKLVQAVIQRIKSANIREKVYAVELNYQSGGAEFPPCIVCVPESYRLELIQSGSSDLRFHVFLPLIEQQWFFTIDDPETLEACQTLEQEIQAGEKWETAARILRDVAAALTRYNWNGILDTTSDFVVYAADFELDGPNLAKVLGSSVSQKQIREWKSKGWL